MLLPVFDSALKTNSPSHYFMNMVWVQCAAVHWQSGTTSLIQYFGLWYSFGLQQVSNDDLDSWIQMRETFTPVRIRSSLAGSSGVAHSIPLTQNTKPLLSFYVEQSSTSITANFEYNEHSWSIMCCACAASMWEKKARFRAAISTQKLIRNTHLAEVYV